MTLPSAVVLDLFVVFSAIALLALRGGLRASHPAVLYIGFHLAVLSTRSWALLNGAPATLFVTEQETVKALLVADLGLACATVGWLTARALSTSAPAAEAGDSEWWRPFDDRRMWAVIVATVPVGLVALVTYARIPGSEAAQSEVTTAYQTLAVTWPGLALLVLIYRYGFRWYLMFPMLAYLSLMAVQGFGRYRLVLPLILLVIIWLDRRGRAWPPVWMLAGFVAVAILFVPLKSIGVAIQAGGGLEVFRDEVSRSIEETSTGTASDQTILDGLAATISLSDAHGSYFLGSPYLNVLTLPIPRPLWEGKPGLNEHFVELSTPIRPLATIGAVPTLPGDLYLNFGWLGVGLVMFVFARWTASLWRRAYSSVTNHRSAQRLLFLLFFAASVQVARDGLISLPVFIFVHQLPLAAIVALHFRIPRRELSPRRRPPNAVGRTEREVVI